MSNASQGGRGWSGKYNDMHYFDLLPPTARRALADAAFEWSSGWVHGAWRRGKRGYTTGPDIAARIAETDARQIAQDRRRIWKISD
jgi:hypothetical protein